MKSRLGLLVVAWAIVSVACGTDQTVSATTEATTSSSTTSTTEPDEGDAVSDYLVLMSNLDADIGNQVGEFECSYNEQFSPGFCGGGFVEEGEEFEPPPEPTEEEQLEYQSGYWLGTFDLHLAHADVLESVVAPTGFESAHQEYAAAYRSYFAFLRDGVAGLTTMAEFESFLNPLFDPLATIPADLERVLFGAVDACRALEQMAAEAGFRADLGCPNPPPKPVSVDVEVGDVWVAAPNPLEVGEGLVTMRITNTGDEAIRPVVLQIFEGDPLNLPVVGGVVDISRSGEFEATGRYAGFHLAYAGENEVFIDESGVTGEPPELLPGESVDAVIWSEGTMVVLDYRQGEFEAGAYVVIERSD